MQIRGQRACPILAGFECDVEEYALVRKQDYVNFEQFWMFLKKQNNKCDNIDEKLILPWYTGDLIEGCPSA